MPKQNRSSTPEEELPAAAIAFMRGGSHRPKERPGTLTDESDSADDDSPQRKITTPRVKKRRRTNGGGHSSVHDSSPLAMEAPRRPFSTRIRTDLYARLKEASLTRELKRNPPFHMSEIVEQAIEAWLEIRG